jgi:hypothetical protein
MSWFPWILGMLILQLCWGKVITGVLPSLCRFSPFHQPLENTLVSDRKKYPMLPTSVYGNKIVVGYEDAMRTIQKGGDECSQLVD